MRLPKCNRSLGSRGYVEVSGECKKITLHAIDARIINSSLGLTVLVFVIGFFSGVWPYVKLGMKASMLFYSRKQVECPQEAQTVGVPGCPC